MHLFFCDGKVSCAIPQVRNCPPLISSPGALGSRTPGPGYGLEYMCTCAHRPWPWLSCPGPGDERDRPVRTVLKAGPLFGKAELFCKIAHRCSWSLSAARANHTLPFFRGAKDRGMLCSKWCSNGIKFLCMSVFVKCEFLQIESGCPLQVLRLPNPIPKVSCQYIGHGEGLFTPAPTGSAPSSCGIVWFQLGAQFYRFSPHFFSRRHLGPLDIAGLT